MHRPRKDGDRQEDIDLWQTLRSDQTLNITISSGGPRPAAYLKIRTGGGQIQSEGNRIDPPLFPIIKLPHIWKISHCTCLPFSLFSTLFTLFCFFFQILEEGNFATKKGEEFGNATPPSLPLLNTYPRPPHHFLIIYSLPFF